MAALAPISISGLEVSLEPDLVCGSLRYHEPAGAAASSVQALFNCPLPEPLAAIQSSSESGTNGRATVTLIWRGPTETLVLSPEPAVLARIQSAVAGLTDGCFIDQSGGYRVIRLAGSRVAAVFARLGNPDSMPAAGQARRSRLADVPVLSVHLAPDRFLLMVERVYAPHLFDWLRQTVLDLEDRELRQ